VRRSLLTATAALLTVAALLLGRLWLQRLSLPYNEEGRHFDAANAVVHDETALAVIGMLTALFAILAALSIFLASRAWRK
jgi:hypothetical protein